MTPSQAAQHNEGTCDLCTGWHDAEEAAFMNRRASQAAQEKPTSPRPDRCDWIEVGQPYPNECGRTLPCDRHGGDAEGHPFGFVNLARQHAEGTVAALQAAGFSDDDMVRFLDAIEASGLTLIPREAAAATPSLDVRTLAAAGTMRFDPVGTDAIIEARLAAHGIDYEYIAEFLTARLARLDEGSATPDNLSDLSLSSVSAEGSATPDQGKGEPR